MTDSLVRLLVPAKVPKNYIATSYPPGQCAAAPDMLPSAVQRQLFEQLPQHLFDRCDRIGDDLPATAAVKEFGLPQDADRGCYFRLRVVQGIVRVAL